jgi:hypothetical protein
MTDNIKAFLEADALLQAARGDDYGKAYIVLRDAAMNIAPDLAKMVEDLRVAKEALEGMFGDFIKVEMLRGDHTEVRKMVAERKEKAKQALTRLKPYEKLFEKEGER